ncbi:class I SAM-dependent methyltransferase [Actimicrobium sp. CCC2.4]|uniref:class I SAM-dependent methyltransferase n=1 Tax=Actimicrobium sp. CCC2.4 TaxID=3048606 RepID=UPI002AC946AE|nr:class I SAM-dependent methyltransferase [Actimicrobium sp. CCC2.4]MEB0136424.1 class I SAM-dependent methyltransferase [Actimicrobium sp. CCC2.4]WPX31243.1 class I SAM-dependent methyltransferase [Actimicrobium sp. CCC2.4]
MQWSQGYVADLDYPAGFYQEQGPDYLNIACVLNEVEPVRTDRPYTYLELGCGMGNTLAILAAGHPMGTFYGIDFMPSHISTARRIAGATHLENLHYLEHSFSDLVDGSAPALPQCDFITLHGVYAWISRESQQHLITILKRHLKPGGIVYISYNALPGWNADRTLMRLMREFADGERGDSASRLRSATRFMEQFDLEQGGGFSETPALKNLLDTLNKGNAAYLAHEYLHQFAEPLYHLDVARDLAAAKLDFIGSSDLCEMLPRLYLNDEKQAVLEKITDPALRETAKDFFLNRKFRRDVFVRGARKMTPTRQAEWLQTLSVALLKPHRHVNLNKLPAGLMEVCIDQAGFAPTLEKLAAGPCTLAHLLGADAMKNRPFPAAFGVILMLTGSSQAALYVPRTVNPDAAQRLNAVLADEGHHNDHYRTLASPLTGSGVVVNPVELLVVGVLRQRPEEILSTVIAQARASLARRGRRLRRDGVMLESDEENQNEIALYARTAMEDKLPLWRQLGML